MVKKKVSKKAIKKKTSIKTKKETVSQEARKKIGELENIRDIIVNMFVSMKLSEREAFLIIEAISQEHQKINPCAFKEVKKLEILKK